MFSELTQKSFFTFKYTDRHTHTLFILKDKKTIAFVEKRITTGVENRKKNNKHIKYHIIKDHDTFLSTFYPDLIFLLYRNHLSL